MNIISIKYKDKIKKFSWNTPFCIDTFKTALTQQFNLKNKNCCGLIDDKGNFNKHRSKIKKN